MSKKTTVGERLKDERTRLGYNIRSFAEVGGIGIGTQSSYENDKTQPNAEYLNKISAIGAEIFWIMRGAAEDDAVRDKRGVTPTAPLHAPDGFILVPHYQVQASAGNGTLVHSEQIVDYLAFKADWVRNTLGVAQKDLALISVKGDSMEPMLSNEDLILVDMRRNHVEDNAVYVLQMNETLLVKRIQHKLDGSLHVMSDNPRYQTEIVSAARSTELHVLGRVVWSGRRM